MTRIEFLVSDTCRNKAKKQGMVFDGKVWFFDEEENDPRWFGILNTFPLVYVTEQEKWPYSSQLLESADFDATKQRWFGEWCVFRQTIAPTLANTLQGVENDVFLQEMLRWQCLDDTLAVSGVYVIKLDNGTIYVGKSKDMVKRLRQHMTSGGGAQWCRANGCNDVRLLPTRNTKAGQSITTMGATRNAFQMLRHGPDKVRGWIFTNEEALTQNELKTIYRMLADRTDCCFKCGMYGHYSTSCSANSAEACWKDTD